MRLQWAVLALRDRNAIFDGIKRQDAVDTLAEFPMRRRPGRVEGTRELVIARTPFVAAYAVLGDTVRLLRILHGSQQWPDAF